MFLVATSAFLLSIAITKHDTEVGSWILGLLFVLLVCLLGVILLFDKIRDILGGSEGEKRWHSIGWIRDRLPKITWKEPVVATPISIPLGKIRYTELFAGIGGLGLAFERAAKEMGLEPILVESVEIDNHAADTYHSNFGLNPLGDVRDVVSLKEHDVLLAGFPCQSFSYAGEKRGFGDIRGTLFFDIMRLVDKGPPKLLILENVRGLLSNDGGKTFKTIQYEIEKRGYSFDWLLLNSVNFGVPQNRVRVYMICILNRKEGDLLLESDKGPPDSNNISSLGDGHPRVASILEENVPDRYNCSSEFIEGIHRALGGDLSTLHGRRFIDYRGGHSIHSWEMGSRGICSSREIEFMNRFITERRNKKFGTHRDGKMLTREQISSFWEGGDLDKVLAGLLSKKYLKIVDGDKYKPVAGNYSFEVYKFLDPEKISVTVVASDCSRLGVYHEDRIRRLTPREVARLQGFPEDFVLHSDDSKAYFQLGNAVTVSVAKKVCSESLRLSIMEEPLSLTEEFIVS
jgi:DNA (cytosine-5)-methyltransferase 1